MKYWSGLIALFMILAFFLGLSVLSKESQSQKIKDEIACVEAGGQVQNFPYMCTTK